MQKLISQLFARKKFKSGYQDLGLIATKVVTTVFFELLVDALQSNIDLSTFKYHGSGTGTTAASMDDTILEAEVESRATGTQEEHDATTYKSVAEIDYTASLNITEHGIFSSGGILLDRSVFAAIEVENGQSIEFIYLFSPTGITADIEICVNMCNDPEILLKAEKLNQYLRVMAPSLYGLGIKDQEPEIFQRQLTDLNAKVPDLEDSDQAERNKDLYEQDYRNL